MRGRRPGDGHDRGADLLRRLAGLATVVGVAGLAACGSDDGGTGVGVRRLQDAALLAESTPNRCPLDLGFPEALGGDVRPRAGNIAFGTSVGKAAAGSPLRAVGGAAYRCEYDVGGKPASLVVVAVPEGQQTAAAVGALATPLQDAGLDSAVAQQLVDAAKAAKPGQAVGASAGTASAASATLPGGGAASVAVVAAQGGPPAATLTKAAEKLAAELSG